MAAIGLLRGRNNVRIVQVTKSDAAWSLVGSTGNWVDADPSGNAAARTYDLVVPNVKAGDWIGFVPNGLITSAAGACSFDVFTYVAGAPVHQFGSATTGQAAWSVSASHSPDSWAPITFYQVQASDIESGAVRLRLRYLLATGSTRTLFGGVGFNIVLTAVA